QSLQPQARVQPDELAFETACIQDELGGGQQPFPAPDVDGNINFQQWGNVGVRTSGGAGKEQVRQVSRPQIPAARAQAPQLRKRPARDDRLRDIGRKRRNESAIASKSLTASTPSLSCEMSSASAN